MLLEILEPVGLFLILLSVFWRVFLAEEVKSIAEGVWKFQVESKIGSIFGLLATPFRADHPNLSNVGSAFNVDDVEKSWKLAGTPVPVQKQSKTFSRIADVLFILGSILVLLAKTLPILKRASII